MRHLVVCFAFTLIACGERERDPSVTPRDSGLAVDAADAAVADASDAVAGDDGVSDSGFDGGFEEDAEPMDVIQRDAIPSTFDDAGCLTFQGASTFCGFNSNERICNLAVTCSLSTTLSQCQINCEMGTTVRCYSTSDVACVQMALAGNNCTALAACNWIF